MVSRKQKIAALGLASLVGLTVAAAVAKSQIGARLAVECSAQASTDRTLFICAVLNAAGVDTFTADSYGGVVELKGSGSAAQTISLDNAKVGPSGRGGAREVNGDIEVVDGAGRVTHRNFSPLTLQPFSPFAASVGMFGDAQQSPVMMSAVSPVEGVNSGKAVFVGDATDITVDVSGRPGADGRSAGVSAAMQVLRGELGSSSQIQSLVADMGLGATLSEPTLTASALAGSAGSCATLNFKSPTSSADGLTFTATTQKATDLLVERSICGRQTSQEFSIQTVCARPPEITQTLRCEYPDIIRFAPIWRRPTEDKKISISCSQSVPAGVWETACSAETYAVAGSVLRPEYITLKPSASIMEGMAQPLHAPTNCLQNEISLVSDSDSSGDSNFVLSLENNATPASPVTGASLGTIDAYTQYITSDEFTGTGLFTGDPAGKQAPVYLTSSSGGSVQDCSGNPMTKMDRLRTTGALVYRYNHAGMPGTDAERQDGPLSDVRKLSYWADQKSVVNPTSQRASDYDATNTSTSTRPAYFYLLDPAAATTSADSAARTAYLAGLNALGFPSPPDVTSALVSYSKLESQRSFLDPADPTGQTPFPDLQPTTETNSLRDILCNLARPLADPNATPKVTASAVCDSILTKFGLSKTAAGATPDLVANYRFREKIVYTFTDLRAGLALNRKADPSDPASAASTLRALTVDPIQLEPQAIFIPGDLDVLPVTTVQYCKNIEVDSSDNTLISTNTPLDFIGPEMIGGAGFSTYATDRNQDFGYQNQSPESDYNQAPTVTVYPWANSFMRVKTIPAFNTTLNNGCDVVTVTHNLTPNEKVAMAGFRSRNGILITSTWVPSTDPSKSQNRITVYMSPVKTPHDGGGRLNVQESLSPGLYMPLVNVAPMQLENGDNFAGESQWSGYGIPSRADLSEMFNSKWEEQFPPSATFTLSTPFSLGINYYAIPAQSVTTAYSLESPSSDVSYPLRKFVAMGTRTLSGAAATAADESDVRMATGTSTNSVPRYIKSFMSLHLAMADGPQALSPTTVAKTNVREYGNVQLRTRTLLTSHLGGPTGDSSSPNPYATCTSQSMVSTLKYPTKLISRRAEPNVPGAPVDQSGFGVGSGSDADTNVVVDGEVSTPTDTSNQYPSTGNSFFFTRPYLPTTMRGPAGDSNSSIEEPINLAQDYNSFLAQIQTNSSLERGLDANGNGTFDYPLDPGTKLASYGLAYYDETLTRAGVRLRLQDISTRAPLMGPLSVASDSGRQPLSIAETNCFTSGNLANYCFAYTPGDTFRSNQPPFTVLAAGATGGTTLTAIPESRVPLFIPVRPYQQFARTDSGWASDNGSCDVGGPTSWVARPDCYQSFEFNSGHFFPFLRTKRWLFYGGHDRDGLDTQFTAGVVTGTQNTKSGAPTPPCDRDAGLTVTQASPGTPESDGNCTAAVTALPVPVYQQNNLPNEAGAVIAGPPAGAPGQSDNGGADFNPGGFYLPPFGVAGANLHFSRFLSAFNHNCITSNNFEVLSAAGLSGPGAGKGNCSLPPLATHCDTICVSSGPPIHDYEAAFHTFHGYNGNPAGSGSTLDFFGVGPDPGNEAASTASDAVAEGDKDLFDNSASEMELSWVGTSGFLFNDCSNSFVQSDVISARNYDPAAPAAGGEYGNGNSGTPSFPDAVPLTPNTVFLNKGATFQLGFMPTGLTVDNDDGGVYFGPLLGQDLKPFLQGKHTRYTNSLVVLPGTRQKEQVPTYATNGNLAGQIIAADQASNGKFNAQATTIERNPVATQTDRLFSVGQAIADATADLDAQTAPTHFDYEPRIALVPEVLVAFFIHSDVGSQPTLADGSNINPYCAGNGVPGMNYFDTILGSFLSPGSTDPLQTPPIIGEKAAISDCTAGGFTKNHAAVLKDANNYLNYVRPMVFNFTTAPAKNPGILTSITTTLVTTTKGGVQTSTDVTPTVPQISFSWELDGHSLNMSVINLNVANGASTIDGSSVDGIAAGVAVAYDTTTASATSSRNSSPSTFGALTDAIDIARLDNQAGSAAVPTILRSDGLDNDTIRDMPLVLHDGTNTPQGTGVTYYISPNEVSPGPRPWYFAQDYCGSIRTTSSTYIKGADSFDVVLGNDATKVDPYDFICIGAAIRAQPTSSTPTPGSTAGATNCNSTTGSLNCINTTDVTDNLYWTFVKVDARTTVSSATSAQASDAPPSCPAGSTTLSQIFQVEGISAKTTYTAAAGWAGALNISTDPSCPQAAGALPTDPPMIEVGRLYTTLYADINSCYDESTGASVPDLRSLDHCVPLPNQPISTDQPTCEAGGGLWVTSDARTNSNCPAADYCSISGIFSEAACLTAQGQWEDGSAGTWTATTIDGVIPGPGPTQGLYKEVGSIESTAFTPNPAFPDYVIFSGTRAKSPLSMQQIRKSAQFVTTPPSATSSPPDSVTGAIWDLAGTVAAAPLTCDVVPYNPQNGTDAGGSPDGMPVLIAKWSFLDTQQRYGGLDSYYVMTTPKQAVITDLTAGTAATIANAADACTWSGAIGAAGGPVAAVPLLRAGAGAVPDAPTDYSGFTYPVGYSWVGGASNGLTTQQPTPWSSERTDGQVAVAPTCDVFNDAQSIGHENIFPVTAATLGVPTVGENNLFTINSGTAAVTFQANIAGALDSSLNNVQGQFVTGGFWTPVGTEQVQLTKANSVVPVTCTIYANSSSGQDHCTAPIPLTYQTMEGYQVTVNAEAGEQGGNAGTAVVLTTFKPGAITILSSAGQGGKAGGTDLGGTPATQNFVCYQTGTDPLNPYMTIYRFNKSVINVAPASPGNSGQAGGPTSDFFGWGVMPDATNWLKRTIIDSTTTSPVTTP